jgi:ribose transport system substrate-binding protein
MLRDGQHPAAGSPRRRRTRAGTLVAVCGLAAIAAAGCGDAKSTGGSATAASGAAKPAAAKDCSVAGKTIQYVGPLKSNPTLQVMAAGFSQEAKKAGFTGKVLLAEDADPQKVIALGKQALAQGSQGLVVLAFDPALYPLMKQAAAQGVPVVETHDPVPNAASLGITQIVRPDPSQYGAAAADAIGAKIGGKGSVAITQGGFNPTENLAASAFKKEMAAKYPDVKVLKSQLEGFDPAAAVSKAVSILQSDKKIVAAYSTTGGGPVTWAGAQDQSGRKLTIIGMDYTRPNLDLVKAGKVYGIAAQPIYQEHAAAVDALKEKICGGTPKAEITPDSPIVTKAELPEYYSILAKTGT